MATVGNKFPYGVLNRSGYVAQTEFLFQLILLDLFGKPSSCFLFPQVAGTSETSSPRRSTFPWQMVLSILIVC